MAADPELLDRVARYLSAQAEPAGAGDIVTAALGLPPMVTGLAEPFVHRLISGDPRFVEISWGHWILLKDHEPKTDHGLPDPYSVVVASYHPPRVDGQSFDGTVVHLLKYLDARKKDHLRLRFHDFIGPFHLDPAATQRRSTGDSRAVVRLLRFLDGLPLVCRNPRSLLRNLGISRDSFLPDLLNLDQLARNVADSHVLSLGGRIGYPVCSDPYSIDRALLLGEVYFFLLEQIGPESRVSFRQVSEAAQRTSVEPEERALLLKSKAESVLPVSGVYLMVNTENEVIYVGKSSNLHRRLLSYFAPSAYETDRQVRLLPSIEDFRYRITGSELGALLLESFWIRRYNPRFNTQVHIHQRPRSATLPKDFILILPSPLPERVELFFVRAGRLCVRVYTSRKMLDVKRMRRLLSDLYFDSATSEPVEKNKEQWRTEILVSWLSQNRDRAPVFEPLNASGIDHALQLLTETIRDSELFVEIHWRE